MFCRCRLTARAVAVRSSGARAGGRGRNGPINELFQSFNAISEIRVSDETINSGRFGGVRTFTTIPSPYPPVPMRSWRPPFENFQNRGLKRPEHIFRHQGRNSA